MSDIYNLYVDLRKKDRRQVVLPPISERRTGEDRRLNSDVTEVKELYNKILNYDTFIKKYKDDDIKKDVALGVAGIIPQVGRFLPIQEAFNNGDMFKCLGKWTVALINFKSDILEVKDSIEQIKNKEFKINETQIPFSFIRDTSLESSSSKIIQLLRQHDKSLFDVVAIRKIVDSIDIKYETILTDKLDHFKMPLTGYKFTGCWLKRVAGRTLTRMSIISLALNSIFESNAIIKAKDKNKQVKRSTVNVACNALFSALIGACGAYFGAVGSMVGIGLGFWLADKVSSKIKV